MSQGPIEFGIARRKGAKGAYVFFCLVAIGFLGLGLWMTFFAPALQPDDTTEGRLPLLAIFGGLALFFYLLGRGIRWIYSGKEENDPSGPRPPSSPPKT